MDSFKTQLLREKFVITVLSNTESTPPVVMNVLGNRIPIHLSCDKGSALDSFVVRSQNMHMAARITARILSDIEKYGAITARMDDFKWDQKIWQPVFNNYEDNYNPNIWAVIYYKGRVVFKYGEHHPLFDAIEKCCYDSACPYEESIKVTQDAMSAAGSAVKISYDSTVALNINLAHPKSRCGVSLRSPLRTTSFSFTIKESKDEGKVDFTQCLGVSAAFLESIDLSFTTGMSIAKKERGLIDVGSAEELQIKVMQRRLRRLHSEILALEGQHNIQYRPEKPDFYDLISKSEEFAHETLPPPPREEGEIYID